MDYTQIYNHNLLRNSSILCSPTNSTFTQHFLQIMGTALDIKMALQYPNFFIMHLEERILEICTTEPVKKETTILNSTKAVIIQNTVTGPGSVTMGVEEPKQLHTLETYPTLTLDLEGLRG